MEKAVEKKKQANDAGKFFLFFIVSFALLFLAMGIFPPNFFERMTANTSNFFYSVFFIKGAVQESEGEIFVRITDGPNIFFSSLCTGLLETILLVAAIAAAFEIPWKKRAIGIVAGVLLVFFFNQARILATTLAILHTGIETAEFAHNVFFRVFLFVTVAGFFAVWYKWAHSKSSIEDFDYPFFF